MYLGRHTCLPWIFDDEAYATVPLLAGPQAAPPWVVAVGDRRRARRVLALLDEGFDLAAHCRGTLGERAGGRVDVGLGRTGTARVMVVETQMGWPATEIILREVLDPQFHPHGGGAVIRVGSCGMLDRGEATPTLVVADTAHGWCAERRSDDGLAPPKRTCTPRVVEALAAGAAEAAPDVRTEVGGVLSKESLYAEQDDDFGARMEALGCAATEMEAAVVGAVAESLHFRWGGVMASAGHVPGGSWFGADLVTRNEDLAIRAALAAIRRLERTVERP